MMSTNLITAGAAFILVLPALAGGEQQTGAEQESEVPASQHQQQTLKETMGNGFRQLDQDGDGRISKAEAQNNGQLSANWDALDQDGDGALNEQEFAATRQSDEHSHAEHSDQGSSQADTRGDTGASGGGIPASRHQSHTVGGDVVSDVLNDLDEDRDGQISQQEAEAEATLFSHWDQLDQNRDGALDAKELNRYNEVVSETEEAE